MVFTHYSVFYNKLYDMQEHDDMVLQSSNVRMPEAELLLFSLTPKAVYMHTHLMGLS